MNPIEIRVEGLCKAFGDHAVLRGVDLSIPKTEVIAIVGGSGCGKTVLLNHILGELTPDEGRVLVANHQLADAPLVDLAELDDHEMDALRARWGVVFQRNALFSGSVYGNISLWLTEVKHLSDTEIRQIARQALESVGLPSDDEFLEQDQGKLSGGMAKRLAVARALSMRPSVLFYDEPTSGLDPSSAGQIQDLILQTHERALQSPVRCTTLIITHDKDLLQRLQPRTVMLHEGRVLFDGPFEAFSASTSKTIRPYFDLMPVLHARSAGPERATAYE